MVKMFMRFDGGASVSRQPPLAARTLTRPIAQNTTPIEKRRQEGKRNAIRKMMNVFEPKKGGGCGSCSGAK